jgi:hypothetical protein
VRLNRIVFFVSSIVTLCVGAVAGGLDKTLAAGELENHTTTGATVHRSFGRVGAIKALLWQTAVAAPVGSARATHP